MLVMLAPSGRSALLAPIVRRQRVAPRNGRLLAATAAVLGRERGDRGRAAAQTITLYRYLLRRRLEPSLGQVTIADIREARVQR